MANDESMDWTLDGFPGNAGWELWTYNDDVYPHTIYVRFHVMDGSGFIPVTIAPIDLSSVAQAEVEPPPEVESV